MREIKFRGKRKDNGEWVYGCYQTGLAENIFIHTEDMDLSRLCHFISDQYDPDLSEEVLPKTVGQYTGRKDKNGKGKEAYHHDIIETSVATPWDRGVSITIKGEIVWKNSGWWFRGFKSNEWDCHLSDLGYFEVIGNIHDNPELLQEEQEKS